MDRSEKRALGERKLPTFDGRGPGGRGEGGFGAGEGPGSIYARFQRTVDGVWTNRKKETKRSREKDRGVVERAKSSFS